MEVLSDDLNLAMTLSSDDTLTKQLQELGLVA